MAVQTSQPVFLDGSGVGIAFGKRGRQGRIDPCTVY